jgi:Phosphotransferase enzyme family
MRWWLERADGLIDVRAVTRLWEECLEGAADDVEPALVHGDLIPSNLLLADAHLSAVIDWGGLGAGDPAQDVDPVWSVLDAAGRRVPGGARRRRAKLVTGPRLHSRACRGGNCLLRAASSPVGRRHAAHPRSTPLASLTRRFAVPLNHRLRRIAPAIGRGCRVNGSEKLRNLSGGRRVAIREKMVKVSSHLLARSRRFEHRSSHHRSTHRIRG